MKFLSINTSSNICSVALFNGNKDIELLEKDNVIDHNKYIAKYTQKLLGRCKSSSSLERLPHRGIRTRGEELFYGPSYREESCSCHEDDCG